MPCTQAVHAVQGCQIQKMSMVSSLLSHLHKTMSETDAGDKPHSLCPGAFLGRKWSLCTAAHARIYTPGERGLREAGLVQRPVSFDVITCLPHPQKYSVSPLDIVWPLKIRIRRYFLVIPAFGVKMFRRGGSYACKRVVRFHS